MRVQQSDAVDEDSGGASPSLLVERLSSSVAGWKAVSFVQLGNRKSAKSMCEGSIPSLEKAWNVTKAVAYGRKKLV